LALIFWNEIVLSFLPIWLWKFIKIHFVLWDACGMVVARIVSERKMGKMVLHILLWGVGLIDSHQTLPNGSFEIGIKFTIHRVWAQYLMYTLKLLASLFFWQKGEFWVYNYNMFMSSLYPSSINIQTKN